MNWPKLRFYIAVVLPAAVLMALEIVSSRLLAPVFGSSVYVWGSIISVFLAAMSIGYLWGGRLADRDPRLCVLGSVLLTAAFFQALIGLFGEPIVGFLGQALGRGPLGIFITCLMMFVPSTVPLAMVSPFVVRIAALDLKDLGSTAGHLYALSTAGSLAGTLGATFVLIPSLPLRPIFGLLLAANTLTALMLLWTATPKQRARMVLAFGLLLVAVLPENLLDRGGSQVLAKRMSAYQTLSAVESDGTRYLYSDGNLHGAVDAATGHPQMPYTKESAAVYLFNPEIRTAALIGLGSGSVGKYLLGVNPDLKVDQVDVDPAVIDFATEYFYADPSDRNRMYAEDGRRFLADRKGTRWDFIYVDTYIGHTIPFHMSTREFYALVKDRLNPGGIMGVNFTGSLDSDFGRSLLRTISTSFRYMYIFRADGGNHLIVATSRGPRLSPEEIANRGRLLDERFDLEVKGVELAADLRVLDLDFGTSGVLEDRFAPVNHLSREGAE